MREVLQLTGCLPLAGRRYHALSGASSSASSSPARWRSCGVTERHAAGCSRRTHFRAGSLPPAASAAPVEIADPSGHLHACVVLHDLNLAALWSDRILLLHNGRIVSQGIPETVLQADALARWYGAQVHVGRHPAHAAPQVFSPLSLSSSLPAACPSPAGG